MTEAEDHRRTRIIVVGSLVLALIVVVAGWLAIRHERHRVDRQVADARLCSKAASSLELVNPNMAAGIPDVGFTTARTTARQVAAEFARAASSPHPWDQEPGDTVVVRCRSGNVTWVVDGKGHTARQLRP